VAPSTVITRARRRLPPMELPMRAAALPSSIEVPPG